MLADTATICTSPRSLARNVPEPFHATITPHKSLSDQAGRRLRICLVTASLAIQIIFAMAGLWVVSAFVALDSAALIFAFVAFDRGLRRHEDVVIENNHVIVNRYRGSACIFTGRLPLYGLSVKCHDDPDFGLRVLELWHRNEKLEVARDLSPPERQSFRDAFLKALRDAGVRPRMTTITSPALAPSQRGSARSI
ncbi:MAG: DUF2244 domain-containing protein [Hyphomicrobium sp.]|nr:DUF2244 domain-containing protein [Hyphomicrobium sp.]